VQLAQVHSHFDGGLGADPLADIVRVLPAAAQSAEELVALMFRPSLSDYGARVAIGATYVTRTPG
jgi:hypothetical protein